MFLAHELWGSLPAGSKLDGISVMIVIGMMNHDDGISVIIVISMMNHDDGISVMIVISMMNHDDGIRVIIVIGMMDHDYSWWLTIDWREIVCQGQTCLYDIVSTINHYYLWL